MSAFTAAAGLRRYLRAHPGTDAHEAAISLRRLDVDFAAVDFDCGIRLLEQLPAEVDFANVSAGIRNALAFLITESRPWWMHLFPSGRQRVAVALSEDELQTFKSARLFDEPAPPEIVAWWDDLAAKARSERDSRMNAQGRQAESLSLAHEIARLSALGVTEQPRWVAIDDNSAGYDIQSFEVTPDGLRNRLIEVKSTTRNPPRMILSRGEWETAREFGAAYVFHLWMLPALEVRELSVEQVSQHIPTNCGSGNWLDVEIAF